MADVEDVLGRLESIQEELQDMAIDRLRLAMEDNNESLIAEEKRISKARRSIAKAIEQLAL